MLEDLSSKNGTRVNGIPLQNTRVLSNGDIVELGDVELRVRIDERPDDVEPEELDTERTQRLRLSAARGRAMPVPDDWATRPTEPIASADSLAAAVRDFERRVYTRHPVALMVRYESESLTFEGEARDLSVGGVFICTDLLDPPGTHCTLTLLLPEGPRTLGAVVTHVHTEAESENGPGIGLHFREADEPMRQWLEHTVAGRISRAAKIH